MTVLQHTLMKTSWVCDIPCNLFTQFGCRIYSLMKAKPTCTNFLLTNDTICIFIHSMYECICSL